MKSLLKSLVLSFSILVSGLVWAGGKTCVMEVGNMTCDACEETVTKELKKIPEVASAEVDHTTGKAKITFKEGKSVTDAQLAEAVKKAGYAPGKVTVVK